MVERVILAACVICVLPVLGGHSVHKGLHGNHRLAIYKCRYGRALLMRGRSMGLRSQDGWKIPRGPRQRSGVGGKPWTYVDKFRNRR